MKEFFSTFAALLCAAGVIWGGIEWSNSRARATDAAEAKRIAEERTSEEKSPAPEIETVPEAALSTGPKVVVTGSRTVGAVDNNGVIGVRVREMSLGGATDFSVVLEFSDSYTSQTTARASLDRQGVMDLKAAMNELLAVDPLTATKLGQFRALVTVGNVSISVFTMDSSGHDAMFMCDGSTVLVGRSDFKKLHALLDEAVETIDAFSVTQP